MFEPHPRCFARRVEGIAEANQSADSRLVSDHAGNAAAKRFASDHKMLLSTHRSDYVTPAVKKYRLSVRRGSCSSRATRAHINELKPHDAQIAVGQAFSHGCHEWRIHRCTRS